MSSFEPSSTRAPAQTSWRALASHRQWLAAETDRLIDFGRGARVDGGFGWLDATGAPDPAKPLQLWITTRMTHVFAVGHLLGIPGCGLLADHGLLAIRETFEDREHGGWFSEVGASGKEAYSHSFVLLAAASATMAGRPGGRPLLDEIIEIVERHFWSEEEGACVESWDRAWREPEAYRGANANMHMVEAFLAAGDATGDATWSQRALRIAERLVRDVASTHDWRVVEHFDAAWTPLPEYNRAEVRDPFRPFGVTPGHGLEWSRLLLQMTRGRAGCSRPQRVCSHVRSRTAGATTAGSSTRPTSTGNRSSRTGCTGCWRKASAPPPRCTPSPGTRTTTAGTRRSGTSRTRGSAIAGAEAGRHELDDRLQPSERTWAGKPDVYHALQATLIPRLPVTPSLAGALRGGLLDR